MESERLRGAVYEQFQPAPEEVRNQGVRTDPVIPRRVGAVNVMIRFSDEPMMALEAFSRRIANCVPVLVYGRTNAHVTVGVCQQRDDFAYHAEDFATVVQLADLIHEHHQPFMKRLAAARFNLDEVIYNQTTVLAVAVPNSPAVELLETIRKVSQACGVALTPPWTPHLTISRFCATVVPESLQGLQEILANPPKLGVCAPVSLEVGYCTTSTETFHLVPVRRWRVINRRF